MFPGSIRFFALTICVAAASQAAAQQATDSGGAAHSHEPTAASPMPPPGSPAPNGWSLGLDSVVFGTFNRQAGLRGDSEFVSQNWMMGMASRRAGSGTLTLNGMVSAEPWTAGNPGYSAIFQVGEAYRGLQITDHQHPHDLFMQLSAAWRLPLGSRSGFTIAGGPRGEAALGPVAFMHRPSASENPAAPLSHHVFDSTHISTGVLMVGVDRGPFALEGSWFRGREPDERRYDVELGGLDSWSARLWFRPGREWTIQGSHGFLHEPEQLEPGDQRRTNTSASWLRQRASGFTAATAAFGRNERPFSTVHALLLELTHQAGRSFFYSRFEDVTVETEILLFPGIVHQPHPGELVDPIRTWTGGAVRDLAAVGGFTIGVGGDLSVYQVPGILQFTHGARLVSWHLFVRLRPPSRGGRMWNMTMGQAMAGHAATSGHEGMIHDHR